MKKLYYTDPLKAAWMEAEFGVKLNGAEYSVNPSKTFFNVLGATYLQYKGVNKLYIDPDTYYIFEPAEGDFCTVWGGEDQIRLRNNTAFFTPEVEA